MTRLRDSSEIKEAASLLAGLLGEQGKGRYREAKLERAMATLCERAGFSSAALVDARGLPLATHSSAIAPDVLAAFGTILGDALVRAGGILGKGEAATLAMDLDHSSKALVRRFAVRDVPYLIVAFCPLEVDAQTEIELAIEPLSEILR